MTTLYYQLVIRIILLLTDHRNGKYSTTHIFRAITGQTSCPADTRNGFSTSYSYNTGWKPVLTSLRAGIMQC